MHEVASTSEAALQAQQAAVEEQATISRNAIMRANAASAEALEKLLIRAKTAEARAKNAESSTHVQRAPQNVTCRYTY